MGDRFKAAYDGIDAQLAEMRTFLADVETRHTFEMLEYQTERLETFEAAIEAADKAAQAMAELDLNQDIVSAELRDK